VLDLLRSFPVPLPGLGSVSSGERLLNWAARMMTTLRAREAHVGGTVLVSRLPCTREPSLRVQPQLLLLHRWRAQVPFVVLQLDAYAHSRLCMTYDDALAASDGDVSRCARSAPLHAGKQVLALLARAW
jgi:hypothetical protein